MTGPEFPNYTEAQCTIDAVGSLKNAAPWMSEHMAWRSLDDSTQYLASPIRLPGEPEIPEGMELQDLPMHLWVDIMRAWDVLSISLNPDINGEVWITSYRIGAGHPMIVSELKIPFNELDNMPQLLDAVSTERKTRTQLGLTEPSLVDYANLDNALHDLNRAQQQAYEAFVLQRQAMTPDEIRWEKMQKYRWLRSPEVDKTSEPRWWGFTEGRLVHAVYASSPDEAAVILEEHHEHDLFPIFSVDPYPDDIQPELKAKFDGRQVIRLIPFSRVEWPEDTENMTDEQKEAFSRLQ